jgi:hypothetical protein
MNYSEAFLLCAAEKPGNRFNDLGEVACLKKKMYVLVYDSGRSRIFRI